MVVPEEVLILELLQLVKVKSSEFLLPLQSLLITIPLQQIQNTDKKFLTAVQDFYQSFQIFSIFKTSPTAVFDTDCNS